MPETVSARYAAPDGRSAASLDSGTRGSHAPADKVEMHADIVECLHCGSQRLVPAAATHAGECRRCGYVGWAPAGDLSEHARRALRERPLETRRIRITAA